MENYSILLSVRPIKNVTGLTGCDTRYCLYTIRRTGIRIVLINLYLYGTARRYRRFLPTFERATYVVLYLGYATA